MTLRRDQPGLLGVTRVLLLDRDREPEPTTTRRVRPHTFHLRYAGRFQLVPHGSGAVSAAIEGIIVGRHAGYCAEQDRIVAMHQRLDANRRLLLLSARVVASPFAERSLIEEIVGMDESFECDFRMRRYRKSRARPFDDLDEAAERRIDHPSALAADDGCALIAAMPAPHSAVLFPRVALIGRYATPAIAEPLSRLAAFVIAALDQVAVLAFRAHDGGHAGAVRLHAIGAIIDPARVGILHDHHAAGADVVAAVVLVPTRRRNFLDIHIFSAAHVFEQRPALDNDRRNALGLLHVSAPIGDELDRRAVDRHAQSDVDAPHRG